MLAANMTYSLRLFDTDGVTDEQRRDAERRFRRALEETLGDASLVAPVYTAYLQIVATHGEVPAPEALTDAERAVFEQWQAAEAAAVAATFGPHRYMGDAMYEISV
jgi:non-ribosomal peptide synthetase component F